MTADQRLDQLEPLVAQTLAVADRHTAQLKQLTSLGMQQSDNIVFLLQELAEVKEEVGDIKREIGALTAGQNITHAQLGVLENTVSISNMKITDLDSKLDRLIDLLSGSK